MEDIDADESDIISNGFGLKFLLKNGVIFNTGLQLIFDNYDNDITEFKDAVVPVIGITAWF